MGYKALGSLKCIWSKTGSEEADYMGKGFEVNP